MKWSKKKEFGLESDSLTLSAFIQPKFPCFNRKANFTEIQLQKKYRHH